MTAIINNRGAIASEDDIIEHLGGIEEYIKMKKLEDNSEDAITKIETITYENRKTLTKLRTDRKLTQAELAKQLNMKVDIIKSLEDGSQDNLLVSKIKKYLEKIKIPINNSSD